MEDYKFVSDSLNVNGCKNNNNNNNDSSLTSMNSLNRTRFMIQACKSNVNNYFFSVSHLILKHLETMKYDIKTNDISYDVIKLFINKSDEYIPGIMMDDLEVVLDPDLGILIPVPFALRAKWISKGKIKEDNFAHEIRCSDIEREEAIKCISDYDRHQLGANEWCIYKFYKYEDAQFDCYPYYKLMWMDGEDVDRYFIDKLIRKSRNGGEIWVHFTLFDLFRIMNIQNNEIYLTKESARYLIDGDCEPIEAEVILYIDTFINLSMSDSLLLDALIYLISSNVFTEILDYLMVIDYFDYLCLKELQIGIYNESNRYCNKKSDF